MTRFLAQRILLAVASVWAIATITFFMALLAPGDPAMLKYGEKASPEALAAFRHSHGLDKPPVTRYFAYLGGFLHGDLGRSFQTDEPVTSFLARGFPVTAEIATLSIVLALTVGILAGIGAALRPDTWLDRTLMGGVLLGVGVPNFVIAPTLILIFALKMSQWAHGVELPVVFEADNPLSYLMPVIVLAARPLALIARMTRSSLLETLRQEYIRTARAKGLSPARILIVHALKNAFLPVLTTAGVAFGYLLSGSFVVETIFAIPGVGAASISSFTTRDYPLIQGTTILLASVFVIINLLVDILYAVLDPRARVAGRGAAA
jgi:peptide/nickel transport system permease protein